MTTPHPPFAAPDWLLGLRDPRDRASRPGPGTSPHHLPHPPTIAPASSPMRRPASPSAVVVFHAGGDGRGPAHPTPPTRTHPHPRTPATPTARPAAGERGEDELGPSHTLDRRTHLPPTHTHTHTEDQPWPAASAPCPAVPRSSTVADAQPTEPRHAAPEGTGRTATPMPSSRRCCCLMPSVNRVHDAENPYGTARRSTSATASRMRSTGTLKQIESNMRHATVPTAGAYATTSTRPTPDHAPPRRPQPPQTTAGLDAQGLEADRGGGRTPPPLGASGARERSARCDTVKACSGAVIERA